MIHTVKANAARVWQTYREHRETENRPTAASKTLADGLGHVKGKIPESLRHEVYKRYGWMYGTTLPQQEALVRELRNEGDYTLIVLDALRYDYAEYHLPEYFEGELTEAWSVGHDTFEYGKQLWGDQEYPDVRYLSSATPFATTKPNLSNEHFQHLYNGFHPWETLPKLVDVWADEWVDSLGTVPPRKLTEAGITYREESELVAHYFQPHAPFIGRNSLLGYTSGKDATPRRGEPVDKPIWDGVYDGEITDRELHRAYQSNLERCLESVAELVKALPDDQRIVIMADHGEALGEWGQYGHKRETHPHVRRIPWFEVESVREYPSEVSDTGVDASVEERLRDLGYS